MKLMNMYPETMKMSSIDKWEGMDEWLEDVAKTCLAHMHYTEDADPEALNVDDFGLLEIERAFLTLYALYKKGELPQPKEQLN